MATRAALIKEMNTALRARGQAFSATSDDRLQRLPKAKVEEIADLLRYGSFEDFMSAVRENGLTVQASHGGARSGAGRKSRGEPKAKKIWCGQMSEDDREFILANTTPEERYRVLMAAARKAARSTN